MWLSVYGFLSIWFNELCNYAFSGVPFVLEIVSIVTVFLKASPKGVIYIKKTFVKLAPSISVLKGSGWRRGSELAWRTAAAKMKSPGFSQEGDPRKQCCLLRTRCPKDSTCAGPVWASESQGPIEPPRALSDEARSAPFCGRETGSQKVIQ